MDINEQKQKIKNLNPDDQEHLQLLVDLSIEAEDEEVCLAALGRLDPNTHFKAIAIIAKKANKQNVRHAALERLSQNTHSDPIDLIL